MTKSSRYLWLLLAIAVVALYSIGLTIPLLGPDEPRYAQVAREMFVRGDWITPTLGGYHWFEKPALLYWLQIASYHLFGVNEFAARFGSALFGLGTISSLWILGRNIATGDTEDFNRNNVDMTSTGGNFSSVPSVANSFPRWLALIAASTLGIIVFARGASFDIIITFPITASLVSFFIYDRAKTARYLPLVLFYFFIGVALLAKGLIGIIFPLAIVGLYYVFTWRFPKRTFVLSLVWGTLLAAAIASLWYLPMYMRHGWKFIDEFFIQHHFQRYTSNKYQHPQPFYFYFWVLPLMTLPWTPFFLLSIIKSAIGHYKTAVDAAVLRFAAAWLAVPVLFFSLSGSKLPGYILPAVPAAIIFVGVFVYGLIITNKLWPKIVLVISLGTLCCIGAALIRVVPGYAEGDSVKSLIEAADRNGNADARVLTLHTISYNAEFYAAGRLLRDAAGRQRRLSGNIEVLDAIKSDGKPVVVLIPLEYLHHLTDDARLNTKVLLGNTELAVVVVADN